MQFRVAERRKSKLRLGIAGPSGSGKTLSALLIAYGLTGDWAKIGLIDTENGSGDLYAGTERAGSKIGQYNVLTLQPPYTPDSYITAIRAGEEAGLQVIIIDSLSHAWAGEGGLLDQQGKIADRTGNSWSAWRTVTPQHNALVEAMLRSSAHIIATMRAKTEYVQVTDDRGKQLVKKVGMAPIQRDGMEYEFTIFLDLSHDHIASASKDRTSLFDGKFIQPTPKMGREILAWLDSGSDVDKPSDQPTTEARVEPPKQEAKQEAKQEIAKPRRSLKPSDRFTQFWREVKEIGVSRADVFAKAGTDSIADMTDEDLAALLAALRQTRNEKKAEPDDDIFAN